MISPAIIQDVLVGITMIGGSLLYYKGRLPRQTVKDLQAHVKAQDLLMKDITRERDEDRRALSNLEGQLKVYKDIPLRELADGIKAVANSNEQILQALNTSAITSARTTSDAASAVQGVKTDLQIDNARR